MHDNALHWVAAGLRRTWLVALAAVIACSAFAAHGVASLVEAAYLDGLPPRQAPLHPVQAPATPRTLDGSALVARNMFCSTCTETDSGEPGPTASFKPDAILIATSVGADPRATLRVPATEVQGSWGVGDVVPGVGRIEHVGFTSIEVVEVAGSGRRGTLSLFDGIPGGRGDAGAATPAPAAADPFADRIRKIDATTFEVDRQLVRELVGGSPKAAGARISPISKNGKLTGLRLFGVRGGSLASSMGLQNGDVLEAINNQHIESANTLLGIYAQLDQLNVVELAGTRHGKPLTLTLRLR
ncbi:MAG TPA: type II secretion system protein GspC [Kofleriaceae bacterium]|nr:type II secretion system protein GspC [Kofleriaceae bacterium]